MKINKNFFFFILSLIFILLIFLTYLKQGTIVYKISIILVFVLNLILLKWHKIIKEGKFLFKKKINLLIFFLTLIIFSKNLYSLQIFISSIIAFFLYFNFRNLRFFYKKRLIFYLSIFSLINYFLIGLFLSKFSYESYHLNYDIISNLTNYKIFKGINFHNLSLLFLGIFFLKLKYYKYGIQKFKNLYLISLVHDFLFILNLSYNTLIIISFIIVCLYFVLSLIITKLYDKLLFAFVIILTFSYLISPLIINEIFSINLSKYFAQINYFIDFLKEYYDLINNNNNNFPRLDLIKKSLGETYVSLQGVFDRIFIYWLQDNYEISIFGTYIYNNFLFHSLFLEFLSNFGIVGLFILYIYLIKFFLCLNSNYSKIFFLIIILLNTMDTFMFSHHYQLMFIAWIFVGILDEKKNV